MDNFTTSTTVEAFDNWWQQLSAPFRHGPKYSARRIARVDRKYGEFRSVMTWAVRQETRLRAEDPTWERPIAREVEQGCQLMLLYLLQTPRWRQSIFGFDRMYGKELTQIEVWDHLELLPPHWNFLRKLDLSLRSRS